MFKNKQHLNKTDLVINKDIPENVVIALRNVSKKYNKNTKYSVEKANINVLRGQFHAFVGSNGAGKTTTLKIIIGATQKYEGEIFINQISNRSSKALSKVAYIPEVAIFPPKMILSDFLEWNGRMNGIEEKELKSKIAEIISKLGLEKFAKKRPENFSSGEQKKALLAQALLKNADVFVMDEPAANLDPQTRFELFSLLKKIQNEGKSILISSHVLAEIQEYADSVTIIEKGKIKISGFISEFSGKEKNNYSLIAFNQEAATHFLKKHKLSFTEKDEKFLMDFQSEKELLLFLDKASKEKIFFKSIEKTELGLKEIYSQYALKDSQKMH